MACAYCEGWDGNMLPLSDKLYSGTRTRVSSQDQGCCQKVRLERFCLNFDVNTFIERSSFDLKL